MKVLIADNDEALGEFLKRELLAEVNEVRWARDGATAMHTLLDHVPDLIILDLNLPVKDGEQLLNEIRSIDTDVLILVLTARQDIDTRTRCLDCGADDFMGKPFSLRELRAKIRALKRRVFEKPVVLRVADVEINRMDHMVFRSGQPVELSNMEFTLLEHLMLNKGRCITRIEVLETVWKADPTKSTNIVDVYVNYLRGKLKDPKPAGLIRTIRGEGYMIPGELAASPRFG
jgi:DNA-binding response OmpR family regulator